RLLICLVGGCSVMARSVGAIAASRRAATRRTSYPRAAFPTPPPIAYHAPRGGSDETRFLAPRIRRVGHPCEPGACRARSRAPWLSLALGAAAPPLPRGAAERLSADARPAVAGGLRVRSRSRRVARLRGGRDLADPPGDQRARHALLHAGHAGEATGDARPGIGRPPRRRARPRVGAGSVPCGRRAPLD